MRSAALAAIPAAMLAACGGSGSNNNDTDPSVWHIRGVNVVRDAPNIQFYVDGTAVSTADYGGAADYKPAHTGTRSLQVGIKVGSDLSGTDTGYTNIGTAENHDFQGPTDYTVIAAGTQAAPQFVIVSGTVRTAVADNKVDYQVANAATAGPTVTAFVTAPQAGIDSATQVGGALAPGQYTDNTELSLAAAAGAADSATRSVSIALELHDSGGNVIYHANPISVPEQNRVLFVIADNVAPAGSSPVRVFAYVSAATTFPTAAPTATALVNAADPSIADTNEVRLANASPDAGSIDLSVVGPSSSTMIANGVDFGVTSAYASQASSNINTIASPHGNPGTALFVNNITGLAGRSFTIYAQDQLSTGNLRGVPLTDDRRAVPSEAHLRIFHAAPSQSTSAIDVYLRPQGAGLDLTATTPPAASAVGVLYRAATVYFALKPGTYDVYLAPTAQKTTFLGPVPVTVVAGGIQTLALADLPNAAGLALQPFDDTGP